MANSIHPTAIISKQVELGDNIKIEAYSVIDGKVIIGDGCVIKHNVNIQGTAVIGKNCQFWPFSSVGGDPQDLKYEGEDSEVHIGDNCIVRESATIHRGTLDGNFKTVVGNDCFIMNGCHIAHDCQLGNHVIMAGLVQLGGRVVVGNHVTLGGYSGVVQNVRIGDYAMTAGFSYLRMDLAPFMIAAGAGDPKVWQINWVRLTRCGFSKKDIAIANEIFKTYFKKGLASSEALFKIEEKFKDHEFCRIFLDFTNKSKLGLLR